MIETVGGSANCLAPGVHIGEYRLLDVIGEGGFGIVYRARDVSLDRIVAIKEYMPATLAGRKSSNEIHVRSQHRGAFDAGLRSFINEARLLAKFSHPALVHVYRFFEHNGTAYMVMRHYEGQTFRAFLTSQQGRVNQRTLAAIISPVLDVLEMLHAADCYHRDIAPDNVFLQNSGMPVLLDFGAARRIIGDMTQALTMVLKPGFAPIEQYVDDGAMPQGAWTDIYQIGAMLYLSITGKPPATSVARMINDPVAALTTSTHPGYSAQFLHGVHRALAVKPQDRPQTIGELKELLGVTTMTSPVFAPWASSAASSSAASLLPKSAANAPGESTHHPLLSEMGMAIVDIKAGMFTSDAGGGQPTPMQGTPHAPIPGPVAPVESSARPTLPQSSNLRAANQQTSASIDTSRLRPVEPPSFATAPPPVAAAAQVVFPETEVQEKATPEIPSAAPVSRKTFALTTAHWVSAAVVFFSVVVGIVWWVSRDTSATPHDTATSLDEQQWQQAQAVGNVAALDAYLEAQPAGAYRSQALALINRLEVAEPVAPLLPASAANDLSNSVSERAETTPRPEGSAVASSPSQALGVPDPALTEKPPAKPVVDMGRVVLRVSPWGRVSVNGTVQGTTPPLTQLELPEGTHRIEVSNPAAASTVRTVQVKKGEPVVLSHQFE